MSEKHTNGNGGARKGESSGVLRALQNVLLERYKWARSAGLTFAGARDVWGTLGYPTTLTVSQYLDRYERGGIAARIVDAPVNATWRGDMWVEENDDPNTVTAFEQAWDDLDDQLHIKAMMERADRLSRLSNYAVLLIGAQDELDQELPKGKPGQLLYVQAYLGAGGPTANNSSRVVGDEADATILELDIDPKSERFGQPKTYRLKRVDVASPDLQKPVHWSRIVHVAENRLRDDVFGQPALERVWNYLEDLDKVVGGGSEAFWLRANQGMHLDIAKDMALDDVKGTVENLKEQAEAYKHQLTRWLRTRGVTATPLGSDVANFANPADMLLTLIAGATGIPKRILTGSEMGELASTQDRENFRDLVNGRQTGYAGPYIVRPLVDRLIEYGYLPKPKTYTVQWPHVEVLSETEKQDGAVKLATVNQTYGKVVITDAEIRDRMFGLKPLTPAEIKAATPEPPAPSEPPPQSEPKEEKDNEEQLIAAEDAELLRILEMAIEAGNDAVVREITTLGDVHGHPFHGNQWTKGGRSQFLSSPSDALISIAAGREATVAPEDVRGVVERAAQEGAGPVDLTHLTIEGTPIFAGGKNVPRKKMPQIPSEHQAEFLDDLRAQGVSVKTINVRPTALLPSQRGIDAVRVGQMLDNFDKGKKDLRPTLSSSDNYTLDGHHRWATMVIVDVEHPGEHITMPTIRLGVSFREAIRLMHAFDKKKGIKLEALGDYLHHPFRGNQWTDVGGALSTTPSEMVSVSDARARIAAKGFKVIDSNTADAKFKLTTTPIQQGGLEFLPEPKEVDGALVRGLEEGLDTLKEKQPGLYALLQDQSEIVLVAHRPPASMTTATGPAGIAFVINTDPSASPRAVLDEAYGSYTIAQRRAAKIAGNDMDAYVKESYKGILTHEAGHAADALLADGITSTTIDSLILGGQLSGKSNEDIGRYLERNISTYARDGGPHEAAAELFAAHTLGVPMSKDFMFVKELLDHTRTMQYKRQHAN